MEFEELGLREKKAARTREQIGLCFVQLLAEKGFDGFSVKEVCDVAEIAEATFYNYFPRKVDVLFFMIRRKEFYFQTIALNENKNKSNLEFIKSYMLKLLSLVVEQPQCWFEVMAVLMKHECEFPNLSLADKLLLCDDIEYDESMDFDGTLFLLEKYLGMAKEEGELAENFDVLEGVLALDALLCGAPMAFRKTNLEGMEDFVARSFDYICQIKGER